jgi:Type IV secretion-system coupling protein DNA-binding domain
MSATLEAVPALLHGWHGLLSAYAAVQLPLAAGLMRSRAPLGRWLCAPLLAAPLTVVAGAGIAAVTPLLGALGLPSGGLWQLSLAATACGALGYRAGRALAQPRATVAAELQRGALIADERERVSARGPQTRGRGRSATCVTLAGVPVSAEDEVKHFKLIGATGTGKSTAIRELLGAALARGDRAVIADPDAGYLRHFYRR